MKYSKNFERDYQWYLKNLDEFNFCGTLNSKYEAISGGTRSAKECFYCIESEGKNYPCAEPELLNRLLLTKASINFQIKQWAEGRAEGTLPLSEFSNPNSTELHTLEWVNGQPVYHKDIETQYGLLDWMVKAVENQKYKFYKKSA